MMLMVCVLAAPAAASPPACEVAGVAEMSAAIEGADAWQAALDALGAARAAGCDDPWIAVNEARIRDRLAAGDAGAASACAAAESWRVVETRGEPVDELPAARARRAVFDALCAAREAGAAALAADSPAEACAAVELYRAAAVDRGAGDRLDLDAEVAPVAALCARGDTAAPSVWFIGPRVVGGVARFVDRPPSGLTLTVGPRLGADAVVERRGRVSVLGSLGYRWTSAGAEDGSLDRVVDWQWHALAIGLGARVGVGGGLEFGAGLGADVPFSAHAMADGVAYDASALFEPVVGSGYVGAGWSGGPLRVELELGVDLTSRTAFGDATLGWVNLAMSWRFALD